MRFHLTVGLSLLCGLLMGGCEPKEAPVTGPLTTTLDADSVMRTVLPNWRAEGDGRIQRLTHEENGSAEEVDAAIRPEHVLQLGPGHAVLVVSWVAVDDNTERNCHACGRTFRTYPLERTPQGWAPQGDPVDFTTEGYMGEASSRLVALSQKHHALAVETGSCWQGNCGTWLSLFELQRTGARPIAVNLALSSDDINAHGSCSMRTTEGWKPSETQSPSRAAPEDGAEDADQDCFAVESTWSIDASGTEPGRLTLDFKGVISAAGDPWPQAAVKVSERQTWRWKGSQYEVEQGRNPVPGF